jgi:hypothetical protein
MKLPKLNAAQKSLLIPAGGTYLLGGIFGVGGIAAGLLASLVATPAIYWKFSDKEQKFWKKALTAAALAGSTVLVTVTTGALGIETVFAVLRPAAYKEYKKETAQNEKKAARERQIKAEKEKQEQNRIAIQEDKAKQKQLQDEVVKPPVREIVQEKTVNTTFTATRYFKDTAPEITQGRATLDQSAKMVQWYVEIKDGGYAGFKYNYRCAADGTYSEMDEYSGSVWKISPDTKCKISQRTEGIPRQFKIVSNDGYVSQSVQITSGTAQKPQVAATPVRKLPDKTTVTVKCKELAKASSATGKINWNAFGTGDPRWYAPAATVMLSGKTKNSFGTTIPFTIECRGNSDGTVKVVEVTR